MRNLFFIICAAGIGIYIFWPSEEDLNRRSSQAIQREPTEEEQRFAEVESRIGPAPYWTKDSRWTGRSIAIDRYMRQHLKDPKSVEYIDWIGPMPIERDGEEYWAVQIKYRAANSFGGMTIEDGIFLVRNDEVVAVDIK